MVLDYNGWSEYNDGPARVNRDRRTRHFGSHAIRSHAIEEAIHECVVLDRRLVVDVVGRALDHFVP